MSDLYRAATDACARYREAEAKELTAGGTYFSIPVEELDALREAIMRLEQALPASPDRAAVVAFIRDQFRQPLPAAKHGNMHYGLVELRELLDFIYGGPPETPEEQLCVLAYKVNPKRD